MRECHVEWNQEYEKRPREFSKTTNEAETRPLVYLSSTKCPSKFQKYLQGTELQEKPFDKSRQELH